MPTVDAKAEKANGGSMRVVDGSMKTKAEKERDGSMKTKAGEISSLCVVSKALYIFFSSSS